MIGLGTIVNVAAVVVGGLLGIVLKKVLKERYQETIIRSQGFAIIVMAIGSVMSRMLKAGEDGALTTSGTLMMIIAIALGAFFGELINLEKLFEKFGTWLRDKTGNKNDTSFINGFLTASLTVCVGAMAVIGPIQDGISADHSTLFAKSILDFVIVMMIAASMGKGAIFSAIPIGVIEGLITVLARFIAPVLTDAALSNLSLVGNVLIMCVGVNLIWPKTIRVANTLPAIIFAVAFAYLPQIF